MMREQDKSFLRFIQDRAMSKAEYKETLIMYQNFFLDQLNLTKRLPKDERTIKQEEFSLTLKVIEEALVELKKKNVKLQLGMICKKLQV